MNRLHAFGFAVLLSAAAVLGTISVVRTTGLGAAAAHTNDSVVAARAARISAFEAQLQHALRAKTPALPRVPKLPKLAKAAPNPPTVAAAAPAAAPVQRVIYRRPAPIVHVIHTHHGDDGGGETGDGGDD